MSHPSLEHELFCDIYYLRNLCDTAKFPDWPILEPIALLKEVLAAWLTEVNKKPSSMTARDALTVLGLVHQPGSPEPEDGQIRKAYFRMAQKYHPDKNPKGREMFEKVCCFSSWRLPTFLCVFFSSLQVNAAYEFLCNRSTKLTDQPDPDNIVLILRTQSILFERYQETLHPYKYAGYPMLIKTIQLETADEKLFSKSAPLLAAAAECAYYTVKCSALNAEEMRRYRGSTVYQGYSHFCKFFLCNFRENGLEVLYQAFERCVSVLSKSSQPDDLAVQVCTHVIRFYSVASMFEMCRERMVEMQELVKNICRVFYYKQLPGLCIVASECVAAMSADHILQMHFLQVRRRYGLLKFSFL